MDKKKTVVSRKVVGNDKSAMFLKGNLGIP